MIGKLKAFAAGVLLGLLVAPRSGRESRRRLADVVDRFFETGTDELDRLEAELAADVGPEDELPTEIGSEPEAPAIGEDPGDLPEEELGR